MMTLYNIHLTIIIVTYNAEKDIAQLLESLIGKINSLTEVIIIDGLSTDNTLKILKEYSSIISNVFSEKDFGIYDAMNKGVKKARGKFILFLGSDDELICPIDELIPFLVSEECIYYGDVVLTQGNKFYGGQYNLSKLLNRNICHQGIFYPRTILEKHPYSLKYKLMADYVLNLSLWSLKYKFTYLNKIIAKYSTQGLSSTYIDSNFKNDSLNLIYDFFGLKGIIIKAFNPLRNSLRGAFKSKKNGRNSD